MFDDVGIQFTESLQRILCQINFQKRIASTLSEKPASLRRIRKRYQQAKKGMNKSFFKTMSKAPGSPKVGWAKRSVPNIPEHSAGRGLLHHAIRGKTRRFLIFCSTSSVALAATTKPISTCTICPD